MKFFQEPFGPKTEPENGSGDLKNVEIDPKIMKIGATQPEIDAFRARVNPYLYVS